jgi:hypothetical protein
LQYYLYRTQAKANTTAENAEEGLLESKESYRGHGWEGVEFLRHRGVKALEELLLCIRTGP